MRKEQLRDNGSKTCVLKLDMHCHCNGCVKKINDGVKEISLSEGVERIDLLVETGEVKVTGRMDPEKLCFLFHEVTKKCVKVVTQSTRSEGHIAPSQQNKNVNGQVVSESFGTEGRETWSGWQEGASACPAGVTPTPSAPPLPEEEEEEAWGETVPSERCWYRWSAPCSALGMWAASDITGTLAMYEL